MTSTLIASLLLSNTVLFIGDSHIPGPFGKKLDALIRSESSSTLETDGVCGSTAKYFLSGGRTKCGYFFNGIDNQALEGLSANAPLIDPLLKKLNPKIVLVELGSNYAEGWSESGMVSDMRNLANRIVASGAKCIWISMPDTRKYHAVQPMVLKNTLAAVSPQCTFINSTTLTQYPAVGGDGLHYEFPEARPVAEAWASQVYDIIKNQL